MPFDSLHHQPGPVSDFSEPALPATESYMLAAPASATETPIVVLLSLTGQLLYVSSAATSVLRLNAADMAQRTIYEFMDLDDIDRFSAFLDTLVSCHDGIESKSTSLKLRDSSNNLIDFAIHGRNYYSSLPFHDPSCDPRSYWDIAASQLPAPGQASPEGMVLLCVAQPSYVHQYREYSEPRVISPNSKVMTLLQQPAVATAAASAVANVSADRSTQQPQHEQSPQQTHQQNLQSSQSHPQSHIQHAPEASSLWARRQLARSDPNDTTPVPPQRLTLFTNHITDPVPSSSPFEYPSSSTANGFSPRMADSRLTTPDHEQHLLVTPTTATYSVDSSTMWPPLSASSAVPSAAYPPVPNSATSSYSYLMSPTTAYHSSTSSLNEDHRNSVPSLYDQHMAPQQSPATAPYWQHTAETSPYFDSYDAQYQYQQQQQQQQYNWASSQQDARSYSLPATFSHQHRATVASPYGAPTAHGPIDLSTYKMSSKKPPRRRSRQYNDDGTPHICAECQVRESPEWRKGPKGAKTLCNACGLRWAKKARKEELQKKR